MAKAKSKRKALLLPKGFQAISGGDSWKGVKMGDTLTGVLLKKTVTRFEARGKKGTPSYQAAREVPTYFVETDHGTQKVFQSAGLKALENVKKGQRVYIAYMGQKVITRGHNPMREYTVAVA